MRAAYHYIRRNPSLAVGIALLAALGLFVVVGSFVVDTEDARPLSVPALQPPSADYPFGTDRQGRDLLAVMVAGTPLTLRIGFIAGFLGVGLGAVFAFIAAYYRGLIDTVIRGVADIGLTVPGLLVLIIIAVSIKGTLTVNQMAIIVASLAWLYPTRTIRAQVLSLRERAYVEVAQLSGRHERARHHLFRTDAKLAALFGRHPGQRGLLGDPRLDRPRSARARPDRFPDPRHDALLGQLQRRDDQWLVVVVDGTDGDYPDGLSRPVLSDRRAR